MLEVLNEPKMNDKKNNVSLTNSNSNPRPRSERPESKIKTVNDQHTGNCLINTIMESKG